MKAEAHAKAYGTSVHLPASTAENGSSQSEPSSGGLLLLLLQVGI
jgi:hypothetical protein